MTTETIPQWVWDMRPGSEHGALFGYFRDTEDLLRKAVPHYQDCLLYIATVHGIDIARKAIFHVRPLGPLGDVMYRPAGLYLDWDAR